MVSFTVRLTFAPEDHDKIDAILKAITEESRKEPGCVSYVPHWVDGQPDTVVIYEQYKDPAAVEAHRGTQHFQTYAIGGLYQLMRDRHVETLNAVA